MRNLFLLRHAKSGWGDHSLDDKDRPLNERGNRAAKAMADFMASEVGPPDLVLCSSAVRTRQTCEYFKAAFPADLRVEYHDSLYLASPQQLIYSIGEQASGIKSIMVIAHNPGIQQLAWHLGANGRVDDLNRIRLKYPTGAMTWLTTEVDQWNQLGPENMNLERFVAPRDLEIE